MTDESLFKYRPVTAIKRKYIEPPKVKDRSGFLPKRKPIRP